MLVNRALAGAVVLSGLVGSPAAAADRILWDAHAEPVTTGAISPQSTKEVAPPPMPTAIEAQPDVDTSALVYYLHENNPARVEAEMRRLRALYPNWKPPADLSNLAPPASAEIQQLWTLLGADRLDDLRAEIARRVARDPTWQPPQDLSAKLQLRDYRRQLVAASDAKDWPGVIGLAGRAPSLVDAGDLDVAWRVAEAYGQSGDGKRALDLYKLILGSETHGPERLATLQKAALVLGPGGIGDLLALGRTVDGQDEFASVRLDLIRQRIGKLLAEAGSDRPTDAEIAPLEASARATKSAEDATLLGWYRFRQDRWQDALGWFHLGRDAGQSPKAALGEALALDRLGRHEEARALTQDWRDRSEALADLFVDLTTAELAAPQPAAAIAPERMTAFVAATKRLESGNAAQALGWYAYAHAQYPAAIAWFDKAMQWKPDAKTAEGHLLSAEHAADRKLFADLSKRYAASFPEAVRAIARSAAARTDRAPRGLTEAQAAYKAGKAEACLEAIAKAGPDASLPQAARRLQGWCYLLAARPHEAALAFRAALAAGNADADAAYGLSIARLRSGETNEAVAAAAVLSPERRAEVGAVALAQQANASFNAGSYDQTLMLLGRRQAYAAPTRDLEILRGWALIRSGHVDDGYRLFQTLDESLSTRESRAGLFEGRKLALGHRERGE